MNPNQTDLLNSLPEGHPARNPARIREGLGLARAAAANAHVPDSNFHVGTVLFTTGGDRFTGCNVETGAYEGEICSERNALFSAATHGAAFNTPAILDLVVVSCVDRAIPFNISDGAPCGACRQVMNEFSHKDTIVVVDDSRGGAFFRLSDLLPNAFRFGPAYDPTTPRVTPVEVAAIEAAAARDPSPETLIKLAQEIARNSYAPYSKRRAGAIVVTQDGQAFAGVRVENSSTGLSVGADRVAINRAVSHGSALDYPRFVSAIAVAQIDRDPKGRSTPSRLINAELLAEFATKKTSIAVSRKEDSALYSFGEMYGHPTEPKSQPPRPRASRLLVLGR